MIKEVIIRLRNFNDWRTGKNDQTMEEAEIVPAQLTADEIKQIIADAIASTGAAGPADMGKVMGAIKPKIAGKADGALVSSLVKESLNK
mgnify:CR=1 FL=1